jgi:hypothetical protein
MWLGLALFTPAIGLRLSELEQFQIYKLFNLIGVVWAFFGVCTLSYLIGTSARFQKVVVRVSSYVLKWLLFMVPWGILVGGFIGWYFSNPSWAPTVKSGVYLMFPAMISVFLVEDFAEAPKFKFAETEKFKVAFFGGYFVLAGLLLQFTAALFDLIGFNG